MAIDILTFIEGSDELFTLARSRLLVALVARVDLMDLTPPLLGGFRYGFLHR